VERRGSIDRGEFQSIADSYGISADLPNIYLNIYRGLATFINNILYYAIGL